MSERSLHYYWVEHDDRHGPIGYGVTAFSEDDALSIAEVRLRRQIWANTKICFVTREHRKAEQGA